MLFSSTKNEVIFTEFKCRIASRPDEMGCNPLYCTIENRSCGRIPSFFSSQISSYFIDALLCVCLFPPLYLSNKLLRKKLNLLIGLCILLYNEPNWSKTIFFLFGIGMHFLNWKLVIWSIYVLDSRLAMTLFHFYSLALFISFPPRFSSYLSDYRNILLSINSISLFRLGVIELIVTQANAPFQSRNP